MEKQQTKCKIKEGRIELPLSIIVAVTLFILFINGVSGAGFGSSYLEKVNGTMEMNIEIGHNVSYFIYPQNFDNRTLLIKINITDTNRTLLNTLQDVYEIPPNTESDDYKIEMIFGLANRTNLINQSFPVSYAVLSTFKTNDTGATVSFSPIGYTKIFNVKGIEQIQEQTTPVNTTTTTTTGGGGSSSSSTTKTTTKTTTTTKTNNTIVTPKKTETPAQTTPQQETNQSATTINVVKPNHTLIWIAGGIVGFLVIGFIIFIAIKVRQNPYEYKGNKMEY